MIKLEILTEYILALCIFVSVYFIFVAAASFAEAQTYDQFMREIYAENKPFYAPEPVAPIVPVVPVVPAYPPNLIPPNQYGTGYSVITSQRAGPDYIQQYLGVRNATVNTTVTSVVPNNAWGAPLRPPALFYPYP